MASTSRCIVDRSVSFKDTSNVWKAITFVLSLYLFSQVQGTVHTVCKKTDTDMASIPLNCSRDQMIHVISKLYGRRTSEENCTVVRADSNNSKIFDSSNNGLIVNCNGKNDCTELAACGNVCNGSGNAFEITYECVEDGKDVCGVFIQTGPLSSLYLHNQRFPASQEVEQSCECTVSGQSLDVLMIQHRVSQGVLQITTTGADKNNITWTSNLNDFNRKIASERRHIIVAYNNQTDSSFWLRISGEITHISCSNSLTPPKTTGSTEVTDTREATETIKATEATKATEVIGTIKATEVTRTIEATESTESIEATDTTGTIKATEVTRTIEATEAIRENTTVITVSAVCGVIIFLLLVIIGVLIVYFKVIKPQRRTQNHTEDTLSNNLTNNDNISGSNDQRNTYSDLVRYANQDNDYGKLHIYANP